MDRRNAIGTGKKPAFTLIEILIVLVIIAVLLGILLPVFVNARARAGATTCQSNLHQLHLAVMAYAGDHDGILPPYPTFFGGSFHDSAKHTVVPMLDHAAQLRMALAPYAKAEGVWFCPSDGYAHTTSTEGSVNHLYTSYKTGIGWYQDIDTPILGQTRVDAPTLFPWHGVSRMVLFTDDLVGCGAYALREPGSYSHAGRFNAVMFDGHAMSFRPEQDACVLGSGDG